MTADEWDTTGDLWAMLEFGDAPPPARKVLLLNAAFARRVAAVMPDDACRGLVDVTEGHADGSMTDAEYMAVVARVLDPYIGNEAARDGAGGATFRVLMRLFRGVDDYPLLAESVIDARRYLAYHSGYPPTMNPEEWVAFAARREQLHLCELTRCVLGNPYRPITADPAWLTSDVVGLARGIYDDRAHDRLPILADALVDAGCANADVVEHCRGSPHAHGCWVVDLVLGKC